MKQYVDIWKSLSHQDNLSIVLQWQVTIEEEIEMSKSWTFSWVLDNSTGNKFIQIKLSNKAVYGGESAPLY